MELSKALKLMKSISRGSQELSLPFSTLYPELCQGPGPFAGKDTQERADKTSCLWNGIPLSTFLIFDTLTFILSCNLQLRYFSPLDYTSSLFSFCNLKLGLKNKNSSYLQNKSVSQCLLYKAYSLHTTFILPTHPRVTACQGWAKAWPLHKPPDSDVKGNPAFPHIHNNRFFNGISKAWEHS